MVEDKEYRSYKQAGVNIDRGEECSRIAYEASQKTFSNQDVEILEPEKLEDGFSGLLKINSELKGGYIVKNSDGVGSKALVAQRLDRHDTLGYDLVAMLADDSVSTGALPVGGTNTIDIHRAEPGLISELMQGMVEACEVANLSMVGGEIAELPHQVKGYSNPYIWNGDLFGVLAKGKRIDGSSITPGDSIVGLQSRGIRSNGLTLARKICNSSFGEDWHEEPFGQDSSWGEVLLKPSRICTPAIVNLVGGYKGKTRADVTGIVHITGGGIFNLKRILPEGMGALFTNLFPPQEEFTELQQLGPVSDEEAYRTWNMGQCLLIVTPEPEKVESLVAEFDIPSRLVGEITDRDRIVCHTRGLEEKKIHL